MKRRYKFIPVIGLVVIFLIFAMGFGCSSKRVTSATADVSDFQQNEKVDWSQFPAAPAKKELVAVAGFENKSTYSADKLWDTSSQILASSLLRSHYFRVVEWEKMKQLFDWDTLSHASLVKSPEDLKRAQRILLCEYFITGSITYFDVNQHATVSAFSKNKVIDTTIRVDLLLQDAGSGEYLSTGTGEHMVSQTYEGGMSGGQTGSWDSHSADKALTVAIHKALLELVEGFDGLQNTK